MRLGLTVFPVFLSIRHCSRESAVFRSNFPALDGTVNSFSQKRLCQNEDLRRKARRVGCQAPSGCLTAYSGGAVKGAASAAFIGVTGYGHADP